MSAVLNEMNGTSEPHSDRSQSERAVVSALPSLMPFRSGYAVGLGGLTGSAVSGVLPEGPSTPSLRKFRVSDEDHDPEEKARGKHFLFVCVAKKGGGGGGDMCKCVVCVESVCVCV
jgi:hypothetical protein